MKKKHSLVAQRIVYEGVSKEVGIWKVNIKKIPPDVKQSWEFATLAEAEIKKCQNHGGKHSKERKKILTYYWFYFEMESYGCVIYIEKYMEYTGLPMTASDW